jgi:hypothetical protein
MIMLRDLFGGAIKAKLPSNAVDISDLREVPDNQEGFFNSTTNQSIIIDILEYVDIKDEDALQYFKSFFFNSHLIPNNSPIMNKHYIKIPF